MNCNDNEIRDRLQRLNSEYRDHPLLAEIQGLADQYLRLERKLQKITRISDRLQTQVLELNRSLSEKSMTDPLTNTLNRRGMYKHLQAEINRAEREHRRCGLLMLDIDHFKHVNDRHGHQSGDQVLIAIADILKRNIRSYDSCARWGGEEFLLLLPDCDAQELMITAEKLRTTVAQSQFDAGDARVQLTISIGAYLSTADDALEKAISRADHALYDAKQSGRNKVVQFNPDTAPPN